jgi:release factor glutamine methyltransferase
MTLSPEKMEQVYAIQRQLHQKFRDVPVEGKIVEYLGRDFVVYPRVFWPSWDSQALVKNYTINPGEDVCDVCTGSGVIACHSAWKGAKRVVALDINPNAMCATRINTNRYGLDAVIDVRESDVFSALKPGERFDVVTMNPPFTEHDLDDIADRGCWDQNLFVQRTFFKGLNRVLKPIPSARAYVTQANFGAIEEMFQRADSYGFYVREIGRNRVDDLRTFYAFELRRKSDVVQELAR